MKLDLKEWVKKTVALCNKPLTYVTLSKSVSITAGTTLSVSWSNVAPSGYKMVGLNCYTVAGTYSEYLALNMWNVSNSNNAFEIKLRALTTSSTVTVNVYCYVLCLKEELYNTVGGVVRRLLKALKPLTLERGWAV